MKNKMIKFGCMVFAICMMVVSQMAMVFAAETTAGVVDFGKGDASISIQGNADQSLAGRKWKLHKLFDAENAANLESIRYKLNPAYENSLQTIVGKELGKNAADVTEYEILDYMQSINSNVVEGANAAQTVEGTYSAYRYFVEDLMVQIQKDGVTGETVTVSSTTANNSVLIKGLEYGYYLMEDVTNVSGKHMAASMAIVTTSNPIATMNVKSDYPVITKKIFEDDNGVGWNDIADYEIGQTVPYKYTSNIPNINGYETYYYTWHDIMDEALTFQENSVQIKISGTINGSEKEYKLTRSEYTLITNTSNDDTFQIQISDIKAIVDREFPRFNANNENEYGQTVTVTYDAVLNDKAADDTGRPGFENDVRLEYSNNPNMKNGTQSTDTGYTPWDTVVCFTYRLDGLKINNKQAKLANAKFKIYKDEACVQEVFKTEYVSDENGEFVIYGLDSGTYYLKETAAPVGYRPIDEPIVVEITATFPANRNTYQKGDGATDKVLTLTGDATITTFEDGQEKVTNTALTASGEAGSLAISIVNQITSKLPVTGSYWMPILFAVGGVCMYLGTRPGKKEYE